MRNQTGLKPFDLISILCRRCPQIIIRTNTQNIRFLIIEAGNLTFTNSSDKTQALYEMKNTMQNSETSLAVHVSFSDYFSNKSRVGHSALSP